MRIPELPEIEMLEDKGASAGKGDSALWKERAILIAEK